MELLFLYFNWLMIVELWIELELNGSLVFSLFINQNQESWNESKL